MESEENDKDSLDTSEDNIFERLIIINYNALVEISEIKIILSSLLEEIRLLNKDSSEIGKEGVFK